MASVHMASALTGLVGSIRAGALPATRHLADPWLVAMANRAYRQARIRDVYVVLNKIADDETEGVIRRALAASGVGVTGVVHEDVELTRAWLSGEVLDGRSLDPDIEHIVEGMETAVAGRSTPIRASTERTPVGVR